MTKRIRLPLVVAGCLATALMLGCGESGPDIADVRGTITMDGKPLANATVVFFGAAVGRPVGAATDEEGNYVLNFPGGRQGALAGKYKVQVTTLADPWEADDGTMMPATPETVPMKYNSDTELEFEVIDGQDNIANFDLSTEGAEVVVTDEDDQ